MLSTTQSISSVLHTLIEICKDGQNGFRVASEDVRDLPLKTRFVEHSNQRARFAAELESLVTSLGEKTDEEGSFVGEMHRAWMDLKFALSSGDEKAVLAECIRGEETALAEFHDALQHEELPQHIRLVITQQSGEVRQSLEGLRALHANFPI